MSTTEPYAIIKHGGHQAKVSAGQKLLVDRLPGEIGSKITISEVLLLGGEKPSLGSPLIKGASVEATILRHTRGTKVIVYKKRRRKGFEKKQGHRQDLSEILINSITSA